MRDEEVSPAGGTTVEETAHQASIEAASLRNAAEFERLFGGHSFHVISACFLYASLYGLALLAEVAYQFDHYRSTALKITPLVVGWIFLTSVVAVAFDWKWTVQRKGSVLARSVLMFLAAAAILFGALCLFLPATPITEANFQTYTAQAAYLKDICYFLPLATLFLITPFHFVITMQREVTSGGDHLTFGLLTGDKSSAPPRGTIYFRTWVLGFILLFMAAYFLIARARLLDNLTPGPYMNLFEHLIQVRLALYFVLAFQCLAWYHRALAELKRASLAIRPN